MKRPSLVILRPLGLGDFLTGVPAYRGLIRAFPTHRIVLAAPRRFAGLAALVGGIDDVVDTLPLLPLAAELSLADVAVDLHGRGPASQRVLLAAKPKRLIAFENQAVPESRGGALWRPDEHEVHRWCRMLARVGIITDETDLRLTQSVLGDTFGCADATIVHPGAASGSRRWPVERWVQVVRELTVRGDRVVISGSASEIALAEEICLRAGLPPERSIAGKTSLLQLAAVVARARKVLCTDTGMAHLATAYGRPSVVLFGPVSPAHWGPPDHPRHRVLWAGRSGDPHGDEVDPGLLELTVADVLRANASLSPTQTAGLRPPAASEVRIAL